MDEQQKEKKWIKHAPAVTNNGETYVNLSKTCEEYIIAPKLKLEPNEQAAIKYFSASFFIDYILSAVFISDNNKEEVKPLYNKGIRYDDGSYIIDKNYPYTSSEQYGAVFMYILQNGNPIQKQIKIVPIKSNGMGQAYFNFNIKLDEDCVAKGIIQNIDKNTANDRNVEKKNNANDKEYSYDIVNKDEDKDISIPIEIKLRMPLSYYVYHNKKKELKEIQYGLTISKGEIVFSDSDNYLKRFEAVKTVENKAPNDDGNIDLDEIKPNDILDMFGKPPLVKDDDNGN